MVRDFKFNKEAKLYYPGVTFSLGIIKMFIWMTVKHSYAIAHSLNWKDNSDNVWHSCTYLYAGVRGWLVWLNEHMHKVNSITFGNNIPIFVFAK